MAVGAFFALLTCLAGPVCAQSEFQAGATVRFPISSEFFKGIQIGAQAQYADLKSENEVYGGEAGLFVAPFSDSYKPSLELKAIAGEEDVLGKAGIGYDFAKEDGFTSLGVQYENVEAGLNFNVKNGTKGYIGANTFGSLPGYKKSTEVLDGVGPGPVAPPAEDPSGPGIGDDF